MCVKYLLEKSCLPSCQNQVISAVKLCYLAECDRKIGIIVTLRPRPEKKLPCVLSTEEVKRLLSSFRKEKHWNIFYLIYAGGIRINEVRHLRVANIGAGRNIICIRRSKGIKDQDIPLSK